jgi:hypothetical protein
MASIPGFDKKDRPQKAEGVSLLRLGFIGALMGCGFLGLMLQQSYNRPIAAYVYDDSNQVHALKPVDPNYRSEGAIKRFAEISYRGLRDWNWKTKTDGGGAGGIQSDVLLSLFNFANDVAVPYKQAFEREKVYETAYKTKTSTSFVFAPTIMISSVNPYKVWIMGEMRRTSTNDQGAKLYTAFPFAVEYVMERMQRNGNGSRDPYNQEGLLITQERDLTVGERQQFTEAQKDVPNGKR